MIAAAIIAATEMGLVPAHAAASRRVRVESSLHGEDPLSPNTTLCQQNGLRYNGTDQQPYSGESRYSGTFTGRGDFCGYLEARPNGDGTLPFRETDRFTGTVTGCGTGTVVYDVTGTIDPRKPDVGHVAIGSSETWVIRSESGTRGLVGISGSGADPARVNVLPTVNTTVVPPDVTTSVDATFIGSVRCTPATH